MENTAPSCKGACLREGVREGYLSISHIPGLQQRADLGTKAFDAVRLYDLVAMWGLVSDSESEKPQSAPTAAATTSTTSLTRLRVSGVQAVLRVLVVLYCLTQPVAAKKAKPDLKVDFAWEFVRTGLFTGSGRDCAMGGVEEDLGSIQPG